MEKHPWTDEERDIIDMIRAYRVKSKEGLVFHDDSTKCHDPWDAVVTYLRGAAEEDFYLDVVYARLGEELEDHEFFQGENIKVHYEIKLLAPKFLKPIRSRKRA